MLAPTVNSDKTNTEGRLPRCEQDEAALSSLGVAAPQAMKSPIAADHHGVPFSLICDIYTEEEVSDQRSARGLLAKPTIRQVMVYIGFFLYQGYGILFYREAHCTNLPGLLSPSK
jgi:hypothetical protein